MSGPAGVVPFPVPRRVRSVGDDPAPGHGRRPSRHGGAAGIALHRRPRGAGVLRSSKLLRPALRQQALRAVGARPGRIVEADLDRAAPTTIPTRCGPSSPPAPPSEASTAGPTRRPGTCCTSRRLAELFPEADFVHLVRDGRDVAASFLELGWAGSIEEAALHWKLRVRRGRRAGARLPAGRYHELRYEELVADPEPSLRRLCAGGRPAVRAGHARPPRRGVRGGAHHQPSELPPPSHLAGRPRICATGGAISTPTPWPASSWSPATC